MKNTGWNQGSDGQSRRFEVWAVRLVALVLSSALFVSMGPYGCGDDDEDCSYTFGVDSISECGFLADQLFCWLASFEPNDNCSFDFDDVESVAECDSIADEFSCNATDFDQEDETCVVFDCFCEQGFCVLGDCLCDDGDDDDF